MVDNASRRGAADLGMPLMILAFLVIAGFMYWLNVKAAAEKAIQMVVETPAETMDASGAVVVVGEDIQMDPTPFEGQKIRVDGLSVAGPVGQQGFWLAMPNGNPFLVSYSEAQLADSVAYEFGTIVDVIGTIHAMTPEILDAWTAAGTLGDNDRLAAEFATHYMQAEAVTVVEEAGMDGEG
ncbi:MAG: hypothetical protein OEZ65_12965 [Gemmatimonadota bacterium]|nr:hypothetical protein [Gemmatimonadota bacterium]